MLAERVFHIRMVFHVRFAMWTSRTEYRAWAVSMSAANSIGNVSLTSYEKIPLQERIYATYNMRLLMHDAGPQLANGIS